ncbi:hypothetical protein [Paenibacillus anseongense]|nr:hypothetical protein [Paenibacillus anseongense]MEC0266713.1 hypothetical protein [Paenibacillus anseongense]
MGKDIFVMTQESLEELGLDPEQATELLQLLRNMRESNSDQI